MSKKYYDSKGNEIISMEKLLDMARNGGESNRELIIKAVERMKDFRDGHNQLVDFTEKLKDKHNDLARISQRMGDMVQTDHDDLGTLYHIKDLMVQDISDLKVRVEKLEHVPGMDTSRLDKLERAVRKNARKTGKHALAICGVCGLLYVGYKAFDNWKTKIEERMDAQEKKLKGTREDMSAMKAQYYAAEYGKKEPEPAKVTIDSMESDG